MLAVADTLLLLLVLPDEAPPAVVLVSASASPLLDVWLLTLVAPTVLLFSAVWVLVADDVLVFVESGPVVLISAAANPVIRLRPITVVAAARITCFFILHLP
jgi:hypothetical protein